jgi:hypothetical protein
MRNLLRSTFSLTLLLCSVTVCAHAQQVEINTTVPAFITVGFDPSVAEAEVSLTENLQNSPENFRPGNVTLRLDDGRVIPAISVGLAPGSFRRVIVNFDPGQITEDNISFQLCFARLSFQNAAGVNQMRTEPLCTTLDLTNPRNIEARLAAELAKLKEVPKTSEERNIFASGFTSTGAGEETEGGAEINLNPKFGIPGLTAVLHLKKSTAEKADPRHFSLGANYRSFYLFGGESHRQINNILAKPTLNAADGLTVNGLIEKEQGRFFSGLQFDFAGRLEGEALKFGVTNAVVDGSMQFVSSTKTLFGSRKASVSYRLMPLGIETGHNLGKGEDALANADSAQAQRLGEVDWIARYKFGGVLSFLYRNRESLFPVKVVQFDVQAVDRYLFRREVMFDEATQMNVMTDKGHKPWVQADLKFYFTDPPRGGAGLRSGIKISFNRGSLPPVFSQTRSFQFGFIFESVEKQKAEQ